MCIIPEWGVGKITKFEEPKKFSMMILVYPNPKLFGSKSLSSNEVVYVFLWL